MILRVFENRECWMKESHVKDVAINELGELMYTDEFGNIHIVCELRKDIDTFLVEEEK